MNSTANETARGAADQRRERLRALAERDPERFARVRAALEARRETEGDAAWTPPPETCRIEEFPEVKRLEVFAATLRASGRENPYFQVHAGIGRDTSVVSGRERVNFSSYNYLGCSGDPAVSRAAQDAIARFGTSVSASRVAAGERPIHAELEQAIAGHLGVEAAVVMVGGYSTNVTAISTLVGPEDLVVHDALIHSSALSGALLSGAARVPFPHNDWSALDRVLTERRRSMRRALVILEGTYSMDGDYPDLPEFIRVKRRHGALLMVDEAHSMGTLGRTGRGIGEHFAVDRRDVDVWMGTLSKALASCGGYIAGSRRLVDLMKSAAPGFVYSVGLSPPDAAAALASFQVLAREPERVARLQQRARLFLKEACARGLDTGTSRDTPVVPVIVGDSERAMRLAAALFARGINVQPMVYPAVEEGSARLRFFVSCLHSEEQLRYTAACIAEELGRLSPAGATQGNGAARHR